VITGDGLFVNAALVREGLARVSARTAVTRLPNFSAPRPRRARRARHLGRAPRFRRGLYSGGSRHSCPGAKSQKDTRPEEAALSIPVEYASHRKIRERNKLYYRSTTGRSGYSCFFIAPGRSPSTSSSAGSTREWRSGSAPVLIATGIAGLRGRLPGVEPKPYIIRFTEDRPIRCYRRRLLHVAWSEVITFAVLEHCRTRRRHRDSAAGI
jgi:hypothetical protein